MLHKSICSALQIGRSMVRSQLFSLEFFIEIKSSPSHYGPESTQPLTEMSTGSIFWGKGGRCLRLTTLPPSCAVVMKSGNFNFLEPSGPLQACNWTNLPLHKSVYITKLATCLDGPGSSVGISTGYGLDGPGNESRCGRDYTHPCTPVLGPTQPPVQWVPGLSRG